MPKLNSAPWIDLTGQVAAITGAASGIGRACAFGLADLGASVLLLDRDAAGAEAVADEVIAAGGQAAAHGLDVTSETEWQIAGEWIAETQGSLDILVNSAGVMFADKPGDPDHEVYRKTFAINVEGSLLGMRTALGFMRAAGKGVIINISSAAALKGSSMLASYGASKAAIAHFSLSAALAELRAGHDIRVISVHPGLIETAMAQDFYNVFSKLGGPDQVVAATTSGRPGRPEEVANLVAFLASDRASFISGTGITIDRAQSA